MRSVMPVLTVLLILLGVWWAAVAPMNIRPALDIAERSGSVVTPEGSVARRDVSVWVLMFQNASHMAGSYDLKRPRLPTPAQVGQELWKTTGAMILKGRAWSKRSLIYHAWITLQSTLWGFLLGASFGILCAIAIVYIRVFDLSVMPWAIISQTIPIVALAPMIIVVSNQIGIEGRGVPKAIISAYLCYFPVLVSMVKGLRSPSSSELDLLKTYNASGLQSFHMLRLPASVPYLFTAFKVGIAAALVGTIVGELPTGAISGLGARILIGDQFGNPMAIWAALFAAAILAGVLVSLVDATQRLTLRKMGFRS
ncbi:ABC transporter permease [Coralliovum pocilloporae]|uniref:ABC transporter permease n=1 Tax=Coralliovum pocilloporae TaxID=3066369 RepID=UPI0033077735